MVRKIATMDVRFSSFGEDGGLLTTRNSILFQRKITMPSSSPWVRPVAIAAALFGLLTIFSGGTAQFGGAAARDAVGDAVPFVLWFNFLAGFVYLLGAIALFKSTTWATRIAWVMGLSTLLVFAVLILVALFGTPFEWRTVGAMTIRTGFWLAIAVALSRTA